MQLADELEEHWLYLSEFAHHPRSMAAVMPTNWQVIRSLAAMTPMKTKHVLEIGPGSGRLLRALLASGRIAGNGVVGAIELNPCFVSFLRRTIEDPRVRIEQGKAEQLRELCGRIFGEGQRVDRVYASIPFSFMEETRTQIFQTVHDLLAENGVFIVYILSDISDDLGTVFPHVLCRRARRNIIPPVPYTIHCASFIPARTSASPAR